MTGADLQSAQSIKDRHRECGREPKCEITVLQPDITRPPSNQRIAVRHRSISNCSFRNRSIRNTYAICPRNLTKKMPVAVKSENLLPERPVLSAADSASGRCFPTKTEGFDHLGQAVILNGLRAGFLLLKAQSNPGNCC